MLARSQANPRLKMNSRKAAFFILIAQKDRTTFWCTVFVNPNLTLVSDLRTAF
jgi:hypothetical protein